VAPAGAPITRNDPAQPHLNFIGGSREDEPEECC
jgi:hypothetical protein